MSAIGATSRQLYLSFRKRFFQNSVRLGAGHSMQAMPLREAGRQGRRATAAHPSAHAQLARFIVAQMPVAATPVAFSSTIFVRMPGRFRGDPGRTDSGTGVRAGRSGVRLLRLAPRPWTDRSRRASGGGFGGHHIGHGAGPPNGPNPLSMLRSAAGRIARGAFPLPSSRKKTCRPCWRAPLRFSQEPGGHGRSNGRVVVHLVTVAAAPEQGAMAPEKSIGGHHHEADFQVAVMSLTWA